MSKGRAYARDMREKHIARKKSIVDHYGWSTGWYDCDGKYSKGKIHCSCGMCREKTNNKSWKKRTIQGNYAPNHNWKPSDLRKIEKMNYVEDEYAPSCRQEADDIDYFDAAVDDVTLDGEPLDGKYFDRMIPDIDF